MTTEEQYREEAEAVPAKEYSPYANATASIGSSARSYFETGVNGYIKGRRASAAEIAALQSLTSVHDCPHCGENLADKPVWEHPELVQWVYDRDQAAKVPALEAEVSSLCRDVEDQIYFRDEMRRNADECIKKTEARIANMEALIINPNRKDGSRVDVDTVEYIKKEAETLLQMMRMI